MITEDPAGVRGFLFWVEIVYEGINRRDAEGTENKFFTAKAQSTKGKTLCAKTPYLLLPRYEEHGQAIATEVASTLGI
jgi:hypothetical protein